MDLFNKWARYLEINTLGGVDIRFVRWERVEIGFGEKRLAEVVRHEQELLERSQKDAAGGKSLGMVASKKQVEKLAREIVEVELAAARAVDEGLASMDPRLNHSKPIVVSSKDGASSIPTDNATPLQTTRNATSGSSSTSQTPGTSTPQMSTANYTERASDKPRS